MRKLRRPLVVNFVRICKILTLKLFLNDFNWFGVQVNIERGDIMVQIQLSVIRNHRITFKPQFNE